MLVRITYRSQPPQVRNYFYSFLSGSRVANRYFYAKMNANLIDTRHFKD
jgi:hypothetical protein